MNGFKFASALRRLSKKYQKCPKCGKETKVEMHNERIFIDCECGVKLVANENAKILKYTWENEGNTYCVLCGDKVEGGYCGCFNKNKEDIVNEL